MSYAFLEPWHLYLPRGGGHVVALFGGGGKTSLMRAIAEVLVAGGAQVAVTTTTETEPLRWPDLARVCWDDLSAAPCRARPPLIFVGPDTDAGAADDPEAKWRGLLPEQVDRLGEICPDRVVLVEADGSAGRPLKLHRDDEPVWPGRTSLALAVAGLEGLESPPGEAVHRWGRRPAGPLDGLTEDARLGWDEYERLILGPGGYLSRVPEGVPAVVALLQMERCADSIGLFAFLARLMGPEGVPIVTLGEIGPEGAELRTAYREDEPETEPGPS